MGVQEKKTAFVSYEKYTISDVRELIIGSGESVSIQYSYGEDGTEYISRKHAIVRIRDGEAFLEDCSKNGTFVNDVRVPKERKLLFGDNIHMWGLDMIYLGSVLALRMDARVRIKMQS